MKDKREHTVEEFAWLLKWRSKIQKYNLECYTFYNQQKNTLKLDERQAFLFDLLQLLIGSNFSLWRFAFLLYDERDKSTAVDAVLEMLSNLMEDNSLSFSREVNVQAWIGGYYGNNSRFRLLRFVEKSHEVEERTGIRHVAAIPGADEFASTISGYYDLATTKSPNISREISQEALKKQFDFQLTCHNWLMDLYKRGGFI